MTRPETCIDGSQSPKNGPKETTPPCGAVGGAAPLKKCIDRLEAKVNHRPNVWPIWVLAQNAIEI